MERKNHSSPREGFGVCIIEQSLLPTQAARLLSRTATIVIPPGYFGQGGDFFSNLVVLLFYPEFPKVFETNVLSENSNQEQF